MDETLANSLGSDLERNSPDVAAALSERRVRPLADSTALLFSDGLLAPSIIVAALLAAAVGVVFEAALFRSLLEIGQSLRLPEQGWAAGIFLVSFGACLLGLEFVIGFAERRAGRHFEIRFRVALLEKIPRLADAYFQSRPVSDMTERGHSAHLLRQLPSFWTKCFRTAAELLVTTCAIVWLAPSSAALAIFSALAAIAIPLWGQAFTSERDLRVRTHLGALSRFPLDALLGRTAIEAHGAARAIEDRHEGMLAEWAGASFALQRASLTLEGLQMGLGFGLAAIMFLRSSPLGGGSMLLLQTYWMLNLPTLGYELALYAREYPTYRSTILRLFDPLRAADQPTDTSGRAATETRAAESPTGVAIEFRNIAVNASGHPVIRVRELSIKPCSHVAVVGLSGAGKSTLVGILLGWHAPAAGELIIDGEHLTAVNIDWLRNVTAWVDSSVHVWNRSLLENVTYGAPDAEKLEGTLEAAGLLPLVTKLPDGLQTSLGEGGAAISAGEAQRVRLARAMLRRNTRLAILDEPFMGLEADQRRILLAKARQHWAGATLLYVTHDLAESRGFERVLVMEGGRIVEDGAPDQLSRAPASRYRRLLQAQEKARELFADGSWRKISLGSGQIVNEHGNPVEQSA